MTRELIKELWPVLEHFRNGGEVECRQKYYAAVHWTCTECPCFSDDELEFRIKPPTRLVTLDAEDWLHGGPWWVRASGEPLFVPIGAVSHAGSVKIAGEIGITSAGKLMACYQRRSGSDPEGRWLSCSKESKE